MQTFPVNSQHHLLCVVSFQPLFMSADSGGVSETPDSEQSTQRSRGQLGPAAEEGRRGAGLGRDCVVCQNAAVNKVLLPCRHACVCDSCVSHFQHCPMCRAFIQESFTLVQGPPAQQYWALFYSRQHMQQDRYDGNRHAKLVTAVG